jgi:hypothetical protein
VYESAYVRAFGCRGAQSASVRFSLLQAKSGDLQSPGAKKRSTVQVLSEAFPYLLLRGSTPSFTPTRRTSFSRDANYVGQRDAPTSFLRLRTRRRPWTATSRFVLGREQPRFGVFRPHGRGSTLGDAAACDHACATPITSTRGQRIRPSSDDRRPDATTPRA